MVWAQPILPGGWFSNRRIITLQRFSPTSKGSESLIRLLSMEVLCQEDKPPEHLYLKASRAHFQKSQKAEGNRASTLKEWTQNLTHSRIQGRSSNLKGAWVRPTCWSWIVSWRGRKQGSSPWGHRHWQQQWGGGGCSTKWTPVLACKHHCRILPLAN